MNCTFFFLHCMRLECLLYSRSSIPIFYLENTQTNDKLSPKNTRAVCTVGWARRLKKYTFKKLTMYK